MARPARPDLCVCATGWGCYSTLVRTEIARVRHAVLTTCRQPLLRLLTVASLQGAGAVDRGDLRHQPRPDHAPPAPTSKDWASAICLAPSLMLLAVPVLLGLSVSLLKKQETSDAAPPMFHWASGADGVRPTRSCCC